MADWLTYGFLQRALVASLLAACLCGVLGFFVVLRRLSFIGVGISHAALGGVALGVLCGVEPLLAAAGFAAATAWSIGQVGRLGRLHEDTAIGVLFSAAMALGVVLLSLSTQFQSDLFGYLFGNILAVSTADLWLLGTMATVVLVVVAVLFKELLFAAFDEEVAEASGLPVSMLHHLLLAALALTVVVAMRVVGLILVEALLVIPAAAAYQLARGYVSMLSWAVAIAALGSIGGLLCSYQWNIPAGATIVLLLAAFFTLALVARRSGLVC
ncbi:MAG: metal ABC transporter permease [Candidatus Binatia bacterium]|nr:metal ABC transporter permease [Candidatus Binatia bacterium]